MITGTALTGARKGAKPATRVGVAVQGSAIRMVGLRGARGPGAQVCWAVECELDSDESLANAVRELLAGAPLRRWPRPEVVVALAGHAGQVKLLHGLPPVRDAAVLAQIVGATPARFFLRNGSPVVAGGVRVDDDGHAWGTAFTVPIVAPLAEAAEDSRARLVALTTHAVALGCAVQETGADFSLTLDDDEGISTSHYHGGRLAAIQRGQATSTLPPIAWAPGLAALGDGATRFAVAYGAAMLPPHEPLTLRPAAQVQARATRRLAIAGGAAVLALAIGLTLPPWRAAREERRAGAALAALGPHYVAASRDEARLVAVDAALAEAAAFDARRTSRLLLLERLTSALPDGAALVSLRADSVDVILVVVATRIATVTAALERADGLTGLALVGAVSRELVGGRELERATFRLRAAGAAR
jgi:hypothetical protein